MFSRLWKNYVGTIETQKLAHLKQNKSAQFMWLVKCNQRNQTDRIEHMNETGCRTF